MMMKDSGRRWIVGMVKRSNAGGKRSSFRCRSLTMASNLADDEVRHPMQDVWDQRRIVNRLFQCKSKSEGETLKIEMMKLSVPLDDETADRTIRNLSRLGLGNDAKDVFQKAKSDVVVEGSTIIPGERVYVAAINAFSRNNMYEDSIDCFEEWKDAKSGETPSTRVYLSALKACAATTDSSKAANLLLEWTHATMEPITNATPLEEEKEDEGETVAADAAANDETATPAARSDSDDYNDPIVLDTFNAALRACSAGDEKTMEHIESIMETYGVKKNDESYCAIIQTRSSADNAEKVLETMQELLDSRPKARPDKETLRAAVFAASKTSEWKKALDYERFMRNVALPVDEDVSVACMSACNDAKEWKETLRLFDRVQNKRRPSPEAYRLVRIACIEGGHTMDAKLWGLFE
eukprot:g2266.t1